MQAERTLKPGIQVKKKTKEYNIHDKETKKMEDTQCWCACCAHTVVRGVRSKLPYKYLPTYGVPPSTYALTLRAHVDCRLQQYEAQRGGSDRTTAIAVKHTLPCSLAFPFLSFAVHLCSLSYLGHLVRGWPPIIREPARFVRLGSLRYARPFLFFSSFLLFLFPFLVAFLVAFLFRVILMSVQFLLLSSFSSAAHPVVCHKRG